MPTLVVQMGHCYRRSGATGTPGEQPYAEAVAAACMRHIHGKGGWVVNTTLADENDYAGSMFVAVHCDGSVNPAARGASVGYQTPEGQAAAQAWKRAYAARGWTGFRPDNYTSSLAGYYGVENAVSAGNRRAFIIECGFLTNPTDKSVLTGPGGPDRVALAIADVLGISEANVATANELWMATCNHNYPNTVEGKALAESMGNAPGDLVETHPAVEWLTNASVRTAVVEREVKRVASAVKELGERLEGLESTLGTVEAKLDEILAKLDSGEGGSA